MKTQLFSTLAALLITVTVAPSALATDRAAVKQDAVGAARSPKFGEGEAPTTASPKATPAEREAARATRRQEGAAAAKNHPVGEGDPVPQASTKVPKDERVQARAERKAETRRANKSGEITAKGETGN